MSLARCELLIRDFRKQLQMQAEHPEWFNSPAVKNWQFQQIEDIYVAVTTTLKDKTTSVQEAALSGVAVSEIEYCAARGDTV